MKTSAIAKLAPTLQKPVMSPAVESDVLDALSQFQNQETWIKWGMNTIRPQGAGILLEGPSGTGKSTIAKWMAKKIKKGFKVITVADIGGGEPGESERKVKAIFEDGRKRGNMTLFLDECDSLLGNREHLSAEGSTWQLGTTETLMMEIAVYPGLVIAASNHAHNLDPALASRFMAIVHVGVPDFDMRIKLWNLKLPKSFPLRLTVTDIRRLAAHELTGRQIENVIISVASNAIRRKVKPTMSMFQQFCEREKAKHIEVKE